MVGLSLVVGAATWIACNGDHPSEPSLGASGLASQTVDLSRCAAGSGAFTTSFTHPYFFPATVGHQSVLEGEEDGQDVTVQVTVLRFFQEIGFPSTRVIEEREWVDGALREVSWNYYAQASDGSVCYFGEDVDIYSEDGAIGHDGAWCAWGANQPGIYLPAELAVGTRFQMEVAPGIAMDEGRIVGSGPVKVPYGRFTETLRVREYNPLDGDVGFKVFAEDVGLVVDGRLALTAIHSVRQSEGPSSASRTAGFADRTGCAWPPSRPRSASERPKPSRTAKGRRSACPFGLPLARTDSSDPEGGGFCRRLTCADKYVLRRYLALLSA
jgi:hypothetical protein